MIWIALAVTLAATFVMAGVEGALLAVSRVRARHAADSGDRQAETLVVLLERRSDLLQAAVVVNHSMAILAFTLLVIALLPWLGEWALLTAIIVALPLFLLVLELFPKTLFRRFPFLSLRRLTWLLRLLRLVDWPWRGLHRLLRRKAQIQAATRGGGVAAVTDNIVSLRLLPSTSEALLKNFAAFENRKAADLMTPLSALSALPADLPLSSALPLLDQGGYHHRPVLNDQGRVIGYFDASRVLPHVPPDRLVRLVTQPLLKARTGDPALRCLQILRKAGAPMALVVQGDEEKPVGVLYVESMLNALLDLSGKSKVK